MALTKRKFIDQVTVDLPTGTVMWRETTLVEEDGVELSRSYHRSLCEADGFGNPPPAEVLPFRNIAATPEKAAAAKAARDKLRILR